MTPFDSHDAMGAWIRMSTILGLVALSSACDLSPPVFLETSQVKDTEYESGPYEVRAVLLEENGLDHVRLFYEVNGLTRERPMVPSLLNDDAYRVRYEGSIPGQALDTVVRWGIEACDTRNNCATDPEAFPLDAYTFRIGRIPSQPHVESVAPEVGPAAGGTRVEIRGSDFRDGATVKFVDERLALNDSSAREAPHVEWIRTDLLVSVTPDVGLIDTSILVDVVVENPDGVSATLEDAFTFEPSPFIESVEPNSGPTSGGTDLVLRGANFFESAEVFIDDLRCRSTLRVSEQEIRCETPPGAAGFVDVEVRTDDRGEDTLEDGFEYIAPPQVDSVTPDRGPDLGGTEIEVIGSNFDDTASVLIGGEPCLNVDVVDSTRIICESPVADPGIVDVTVVNEDGQVDVFLGGFNFLGPPVIVQVIPGMGPHAGDVPVRIIGAGFSDLMQVTVGGVEAEILDILDDLEIVITLPPSSIPLNPAPESGMETVDVTVLNLNPDDAREDTLEDGFSYLWPPEVTVVSPDLGPEEGGTPVTIVGRFFRPIEDQEIEVFFGEALAEDVTVLSTTGITAVTPPGEPGFVDVTVRNYENSEGTLPSGYLYMAPPVVDSVTPGEGPTFGGEVVTIQGNFFQAGAIILFGDAACTNVTYISVTTLQCTTPPGTPGLVDVRVINPDGQDGIGEELYEYLTMTLQPDFGLEVGFTRVRILAGGIEEGAIVRFGDQIATDCERLSSTEIVCQSPANTLGMKEVSFTNLSGTGDATPEGKGFTYKAYQDSTENRVEHVQANSNDVHAADLDNDGDFDFAVANGLSNGGPEEDAFYINDGNGFFERQTLPEVQTSNTVYTANFNDDNLEDLIFSVSGFGEGGALLFRNNGDLEFEQLETPGNINGAFDAQTVDFLGDDREDLLILAIGCSDGENTDCDDFNVGKDGLFERTGVETYLDRSDAVPHDLQLVHDHKFVSPDLDGDGDKDLVLFVDNKNFSEPPFSVDNRHRVLYNRIDEGLGFLEETQVFDGLVGDVFGVELADLNGDGLDDVIGASCTPPFGASELVYVGTDEGTLVRDFSALPESLFDCDTGVHAFDADTDGDMDLLFVGHRAQNINIKLYVNRGDGQFVDSTVSIASLFPGAASLLATEATSADFDGDGDPDLLVSSNGLLGVFFGGLFFLTLE